MSISRVYRYRDCDHLTVSVAARLLTTLIEIQEKQPVVQLCLGSGAISLALCKEMARLLPSSSLDPRRLELWWADDSYSRTEEKDRSAGRVFSILGGTTHLYPARIHTMPARLDSVDVSRAALQYADELGSTFFDITLLTMGANGEIAGLFDVESHTSTVIGIHDSPANQKERLSLTFNALNRSHDIWIFASGADKANALSAATNNDASIPASHVSGANATRWFIDKAAAVNLPRYDCHW
ncbi:MAG: 6-phosphogluconolactonase [Propionibacteriaceae bacterium]